MKKYAFGTFEISVGATRLINLDFFELVATFWEPGKQHSTSDIVRPTKATGFAYQAGGAGQTADEEPAWPRALSGTVTDGQITWTAIAAGSNGVQAVSSPSVSVVPSGPTLGTPSVVDGQGSSTRVQFTVAGDTAGENYRVQCVVTAGSETIEGSFELKVRQK